MGKSSSSLKKKKRSKIYSQARIKKRSKSRTRRSNKLKKPRHRDDSVSFSSDNDDSRSSVSISSSSPEDDNKSKRSRSRMRKDAKGSKKRTQRCSSSRESIEDSPLVKKRKASNKNDDFRVKKKRHEEEEEEEEEEKKKKKKKKSVREVSVSSTSSGSWSCSTCHGSSDENEIEKKRGRSERKGKDMRRRGEKVKNERKKRRSRSISRSSSLFGQFSEYSDYQVDDTLVGETNSRRLRSVITVVREGEDMTGMFNDEHKEEMVYDHDDYPSSRSNDSNDGGSKRELVHNSHVASEGEKHPEDGKGEALSNMRTFQVSESDRDIEGHDGSNPHCDGFEMNVNEKEKKNQDSGGIDSQSGYDLELILRQKALENLRTRRGHHADAKVSVNEKDVISFEVNTSTTNSGSLQNRYTQGGGASDVAKWSSISTDLPPNDDKISEGNGNGKGSGYAKHDVQHPPRQLALANNPNERVGVPVSSEINNPGSVVSASNPELSSTPIIKKQLHTLHEPPQTKSITRDSVGKSMIGTMATVNPLSGNSNGEETNNVSVSGDPSSCTKSPCGGTSSNKSQDETSEGSQYQQKTMTVMRGGEMVEVSYKVYIPKKAPALARRLLKR